MSSLLGRYGHLIIDNMEDGLSAQENVSEEGVSEDCTMYEGQIKAANAMEMVRQIAETARDDKEIKSLLSAPQKPASAKKSSTKSSRMLWMSCFQRLRPQMNPLTTQQQFTRKYG